MLATLLAVGSVWLLCRFKWGWIPASFCLAGSMALYESYAEVAVVLLFLLVIKDLVQDRKQILTQGKMLRDTLVVKLSDDGVEDAAG